MILDVINVVYKQTLKQDDFHFMSKCHLEDRCDTGSKDPIERVGITVSSHQATIFNLPLLFFAFCIKGIVINIVLLRIRIVVIVIVFLWVGAKVGNKIDEEKICW